jgi:hypothetical protein
MLHYDASLNGAQEVPAVVTSAAGVAVSQLNYMMDTLWYSMMFQGLSGPINAAHYHRAPAGTGGPVFKGIPNANIMGNMIMGYFTGSDLTDSLIHYLNTGMLYVNVHTSANPGGEIRGQVYRTFREGYTYSIDGSQEVPAVTSAAYGSGMVSIDRDQSNAHYMMVVNGITPTAVHFHAAPPGVGGPVLYNLTSQYQAGGIYGYWKETDPAIAFSPAVSSTFRDDSVYVNFHSAAHSGGEIRGNVNRMLCLPVITSVGNISQWVTNMVLAPNPTSGTTVLSLELESGTKAMIELRDITGRSVWNSTRSFGKGLNRMSIPTDALTPGMYFISISADQWEQSFKLVKE